MKNKIERGLARPKLCQPSLRQRRDVGNLLVSLLDGLADYVVRQRTIDVGCDVRSGCGSGALDDSGRTA